MTRRGNRSKKKENQHSFKEPTSEKDIFKKTEEQKLNTLLDSGDNKSPNDPTSGDDKPEDKQVPLGGVKPLPVISKYELEKLKIQIYESNKKIKTLETHLTVRKQQNEELSATNTELLNKNKSKNEELETTKKEHDKEKVKHKKEKEELENLIAKLNEETVHTSDEVKHDLRNIKSLVLSQLERSLNPQELEHYLSIYNKVTGISFEKSDPVISQMAKEMAAINKALNSRTYRDQEEFDALEQRLERLINRIDRIYADMDYKFHIMERRFYSTKTDYSDKGDSTKQPISQTEPDSSYYIKFFLGLFFSSVLFAAGFYLVVSGINPTWGVVLLAIAFASIGITQVSDILKKIM